MGTPILGAPTITATAAAAWAATNGAAQWFADLAAVYWQLAPTRGGVRPEVAYTDFAKETGFGRFGGTDAAFSASQSMHNPCGLKTFDGTATAAFCDWPTGITAHLDHLALYAGAVGYPRAGSPDPRPFTYLHGVCPTVESLGGHWSPSTDYGTTLVADYLTPLMEARMPVLYPKAVYQPVANHSGPVSAHLGLVVHVQVGDGSCYGEFDNPSSQASSTWQAMKDGTILQFVDADLVAWTEMAGNPDYDSVETEGTPDEPLTPQQCQTLAELIAWGHQTFGWSLTLVDHGGSGITTHAHYPSGVPDPAWGDHPCPGSIRTAQLPPIVATAQQIVDGTGSQPAANHPNSQEEYVKIVTATNPATGQSAEYLIRTIDVLHVPDNTCGTWAYNEFNGGQGPLEAVPWEIILWLNKGQTPV